MTDCDGSFFDCPIRTRIWFSVLIIIQLVLYGLLTLISDQFRYGSEGQGRPILVMLAILVVAFAAYLASIPLALRLSHSRRWIIGFFAVAIAARGIVLVSEPIQEVDLYRYLWDGAVSAKGISPYRYRPAEVLAAIEHPNNRMPIDALVQLAVGQPGLHEALQRVHFGELPTVYPPISQGVFCCANWITPVDATLPTRVRVIKSIIVLFDIGVMWLLWKLLCLCKLNPGWCLVYGWSPLAMKEFANSGHLDSIAVWFVVASIVCMVIASQSRKWMPLVASGCLLAFGIGAKLFPIVLMPVMFVFVARRFGVRASLIWASIALAVVALSLAPMLVNRSDSSDQLQGLKTFIHHWEINDLIFMVVEENLRPADPLGDQLRLPFVVTPDSWRSVLSRFGTPFLITRAVTSVTFLLLVAYWCFRLWRSSGDSLPLFLESSFLTLAWFWFLSPTQNPWYWSWALPLVPFARNRSWQLVSGAVLIYYIRFWFEYHQPVWGDYRGVQIFDFGIVWIEFLPVLIVLFLSWAVGDRILRRQISVKLADT